VRTPGSEAVVEESHDAGRLLIVAPMRLEALLIRSGARGARVHRTGMGPRRSRTAARALLNEPGDGLLVVGFCGGLDEVSEPGEVIVADELLRSPQSVAAAEAHGEERWRCASAQELVTALSGSALQVRRGSVACVPRLVLGEHRGQLHEVGAVAVDMESAWLAAGAGSRPFNVVRVVLDSPSHELLRPAAVLGAVRAGRALRRVASLLGEWAPAAVGSKDTAAGSASLHHGASSV
jgi:4-hydroxy-3-methylbut-2-en-1-yl diphosphate reductase